MVRRQLLVTVDGDGFIYRHRESGRSVGSVLRDRVLRRYPFEFTVSFIAGEIEDYPDRFDVDLARSILALPNVEAASHSWSHPHDWSAPDVDLVREIEHSVRFMEDRLLPSGRSVRLFFWTGRCNPTEQALALVDGLGIGNLNGGDPGVPWTDVGVRRQYHARARNDWDAMGLEDRVMRAGDGAVERFLMTSDDILDGFARMPTFFEAHPELPVHVYLHWYSAAREESLRAVEHVLDWCLQAELESRSASAYLADLDPGRHR